MGLTPQAYVGLVVDEVRASEHPSGPYRLIATRSQIEDCLTSAVSGIEKLGGEGRSGTAPEHDLGRTTERSLELTSYLYVAGASHQAWRRWSALTALGLALQDKRLDAAAYAAIAGEWALVERMRSLPAGRTSMPGNLWPTLHGTSPVPPPSGGSELDQAWYDLAAAVPTGDHEQVEAGLRRIVEWWWEEDEGDWVNFHPYSYPDFDAPVCAAAASAKHRGYVPRQLSVDVQRYLDAGLADGYPEPLYPTHSPFEGDPAGG